MHIRGDLKNLLKVFNVLAKIIQKNPNWRIGQTLANVLLLLEGHNALFYLEDKEFIDHLKKSETALNNTDTYDSGRIMNMSEYTLDLTNVTEASFKESLNLYNSHFDTSFSLQNTSGTYKLVEGEDPTQEVYATGALKEVAYFWEGYLEGQFCIDSEDA